MKGQDPSSFPLGNMTGKLRPWSMSKAVAPPWAEKLRVRKVKFIYLPKTHLFFI